MGDFDEHEIYKNSRTDKTYVSREILSGNGQSIRIANKYIDAESGLCFAKEKDEVVLRLTPSNRVCIKATFLVDDRSFQTVTIQKFLKSGTAKEYFTFLPSEIDRLLKFLANIKKIHFPNKGNLNVTDSDLERLLLSPDQAKRLILDNPELVAALARTEIKSEDIVALGYRREQLSHFKKLLHDNSFFQEALAKTSHKKPEGVWQDFFEANSWIFGISLSLIHFGPLDGKKLQQTVAGASLTTSGKVVDALLRSRAEVSTACFVELKRHDTALLAKEPYRSGCWSPSSELSGAVAQIQGTVSSALRDWSGKMQVKKQNGEPTGEFVFATEPRSFVICGSLSQFCSDNGVNDQQFNAFEMYRRNLIRPEIITFDELYERALLIVDAIADSKTRIWEVSVNKSDRPHLIVTSG